MNQSVHKSVLLKETVDLLSVKNDFWYIDGTTGGGGHTIEIINRGGKVLAIDRDKDALERLGKKLNELEINKSKYILKHGTFGKMAEFANEEKLDSVWGVILDLGISSDQLEEAQRGFSFMREGPLDMRMDQDERLNAKHIVNTYSESALGQMFEVWGEERNAKKIAKLIVRERERKPFETTTQLAEFIKKSTGKFYSPIHPATKIFQALRMTVNREPEQLAHGLFYGWQVLTKGGVIAVISFHSGEDRLVKNFMADHEEEGEILTKDSITPNTEELAINNRARSARLRAIKKI